MPTSSFSSRTQNLHRNIQLRNLITSQATMGEGGHIHVYLDCNSPWSYMAYTKLRQSRPALLQHGVTIEMHPIFLGGVNVGSGNKPPWTLPAKAKLGNYELPRGMKYFGTETLSAPSFFPIMSLLVSYLALRMRKGADVVFSADEVYALCQGELSV